MRNFAQQEDMWFASLTQTGFGGFANARNVRRNSHFGAYTY